jgi:mannose-6-phosphate isomerase-like protein (cupin superfamily)
VTETFLVGNVEEPVEIHGVHGGKSRLYWKRFCTGNMLYSDLDSFEWARVPTESVIGEHVHSRTEEIYFIVRGRGEMTVDGELREVRAGDLVLTPLGSRHSFRPLGDEAVEIIVMEMLPPAIRRVLPEHSPSA